MEGPLWPQSIFRRLLGPACRDPAPPSLFRTRVVPLHQTAPRKTHGAGSTPHGRTFRHPLHTNERTTHAPLRPARTLTTTLAVALSYFYTRPVRLSGREPELLHEQLRWLPALRWEVQLAIRRTRQQLVCAFRHVPTYESDDPVSRPLGRTHDESHLHTEHRISIPGISHLSFK